jgi:hypothetical protein
LTANGFEVPFETGAAAGPTVVVTALEDTLVDETVEELFMEVAAEEALVVRGDVEDTLAIEVDDPLAT